MEFKYYSFIDEPELNVYFELLDFAMSQCSEILLVVHPNTPLADSASNLLHQLQPFFLHTAVSSEWPGTRLLDDVAHIYRYSFRREVLSILKSHSSSLYQWVQPDLPEDLCLLRPDGQPWLVTIAHERDAYLVLDQTEYAALSMEKQPFHSLLAKD